MQKGSNDWDESWCDQWNLWAVITYTFSRQWGQAIGSILGVGDGQSSSGAEALPWYDALDGLHTGLVLVG